MTKEIRVFYEKHMSEFPDIYESWETNCFSLVQQISFSSQLVRMDSKSLFWNCGFIGYDELAKFTWNCAQDAIKEANNKFSNELNSALPLSYQRCEFIVRWTHNEYLRKRTIYKEDIL